MTKVPNFLVVGAAKSGTSSLDRYLGQHPDVYMPRKKEAHYFSIPDFPETFRGPGDDGMNKETIRSQAAYEALFAGADGRTAIGESSVFYLYYPGTAERIRRWNPDMLVVMLLRNPVDRAYSAYMHLIRDGRETLSFADSMAQEEARRSGDFEPMWLYRELGLYHDQVKRYFDEFPREQVKVVLYDDFSRDTRGAVADVFRFLGVPPDVSIDTEQRFNESGVPKSRALFDFFAKPNAIKEVFKPLVPEALRERLGNQAKSALLRRESMESAAREELTAFFAPDVERLGALLGRDLSHWTRPRVKAQRA